MHKAVQGACAEGKEDGPASAKQEEAGPASAKQEEAGPASAKQEEAVVVKQEGAERASKAENGPTAAPAPPQAEPGLAALLAAFPPRGEYIAAEDETPLWIAARFRIDLPPVLTGHVSSLLPY